MKILAINQFFWPDTAATGQLLGDVTFGLEGSPHRVTIVCGASDYGSVNDTPPPPATILRSSGTRFGRGRMGRVMSYFSFLVTASSNSLRVERPDLVISMTTPPLTSVLGAIIQKLRGSRHYIWEMDLYPDIAVDLGVLGRQTLVTRAIGVLADWSRHRADGIIAIGEDMKARLVARGIPAHKIHVAENWADGREIVPLDFPSGPLVVHYSGNFGLAHDVETIGEAMRQLRGDPRFRFVFSGGGSRRVWLRDHCLREEITLEFRSACSRADLGLSLAEGHLGLVTQLPQTCGSVVPSKTYGIMAAGRPLLYIGPRDATPARIIERHRCGWQVDPGDAPALVALLRSLAENPQQIREAGARGRRAFDLHYHQAIGVSRILEILQINGADHLSRPVPAGAAQDSDAA